MLDYQVDDIPDRFNEAIIRRILFQSVQDLPGLG
jgi:hypothetical protein